MRSASRRLWILVLVGAALSAGARGQVVTEFPIPTPGASPVGIAAGPDGNLWFTDFLYDRIGRITPAGVVSTFELAPFSYPNRIIAGPDGNLWFTQGFDAYIGRITTSGVIGQYSIPDLASSIAAGPGGDLWFTEPYANSIGRLTAGGEVTQFAVPFGCDPTAIAAGPDGNLWFTATSANLIGRVSPSGAFTRFALPTGGSGPAGIVAGPDGNLWFTEGSRSRIGRITMGGVIDEYVLPQNSSPDAIVAGADGNLWFTLARGGVGRITTGGEFIGLVRTPTPGSVAMGIAAGPDGNVWITESASKIARITLGQESSCVDDDLTLCLNGGRFQVRTEWEVPSQGTSGHGSAVSLTGDTGTFWFFQASSVEVVVKVLDGCASNGHAWVFAGGLTNVGVTLTVTDMQTDVTRTYINPADTAFQPIQDTAAFATCP